MADFEKRLARAVGVSDEMARIVVETAADYIKAQRPDLAVQVDALLADDRLSRRAVRMIARWSRRLDPRRKG